MSGKTYAQPASPESSVSVQAKPREATAGVPNDHDLVGNAALQGEAYAPLTRGDLERAVVGSGAALREPGGAWFGGILDYLLGRSNGTSLPDLAVVLARLSAESPALRSGLELARRTGWVFVYGAAGAGTAANRHAQPPTITIDPNDTQNPDFLASSLAHELGHVVAGDPQYKFDPTMTRDTYIIENTLIDLAGEAEATIMELRVRDEILAGGGNDIGITGATAAQKIALWEDHKAGNITRDQLVDAISKLFATGEAPSTGSSRTYWEHYAWSHAQAWDQNNPTPTPLPIPGPPP